jgi:hypothetical protein
MAAKQGIEGFGMQWSQSIIPFVFPGLYFPDKGMGLYSPQVKIRPMTDHTTFTSFFFVDPFADYFPTPFSFAPSFHFALTGTCPCISMFSPLFYITPLYATLLALVR